MRFNFCEDTHFKTPMVAPLISVYGLNYLQSQRNDFSPQELLAFDTLVAHLPTQKIKMRSSTQRNDAPLSQISAYDYDEYHDAEYYDSDKVMVCLCVPGSYSATLDPVYDAKIEQHFSSTPQSMGWGVVAVANCLETLTDLCYNHSVTFNSEHIEAVVDFQKKMAQGLSSIHEFLIEDYACSSGVVLYSARQQAYFSAVLHNSTRTSTLLGAQIFPNEEMARQALHQHDKKDE